MFWHYSSGLTPFRFDAMVVDAWSLSTKGFFLCQFSLACVSPLTSWIKKRFKACKNIIKVIWIFHVIWTHIFKNSGVYISWIIVFNQTSFITKFPMLRSEKNSVMSKNTNNCTKHLPWSLFWDVGEKWKCTLLSSVSMFKCVVAGRKCCVDITISEELKCSVLGRCSCQELH